MEECSRAGSLSLTPVMTAPLEQLRDTRRKDSSTTLKPMTATGHPREKKTPPWTPDNSFLLVSPAPCAESWRSSHSWMTRTPQRGLVTLSPSLYPPPTPTQHSLPPVFSPSTKMSLHPLCLHRSFHHVLITPEDGWLTLTPVLLILVHLKCLTNSLLEAQAMFIRKLCGCASQIITFRWMEANLTPPWRRRGTGAVDSTVIYQSEAFGTKQINVRAK